jgi:ABC-type transporter Mla subunit MlaD
MAEEQHQQQQQQRINQAAEQLANAIRESYQALAERGTSAQELNAQLTQEFFSRVIENLQAQAEDTRQMGQQLADQQRRATEAGQQLRQESVSAYMDFVNSMFSFAQGSTQASQGGARDFEGRFTRGEEAWDESEHHRDARGRFT